MFKTGDLLRCAKELHRARIELDKASDRRKDVPVGSSRALITTLNAKYSTKAEQYERIRRETILVAVEVLEIVLQKPSNLFF